MFLGANMFIRSLSLWIEALSITRNEILCHTVVKLKYIEASVDRVCFNDSAVVADHS